MTIMIPPKYVVSNVPGCIKGKSAIYIARVYGERKRSFAGQRFGARGFLVSAVGRDEATIRAADVSLRLRGWAACFTITASTWTVSSGRSPRDAGTA